MSTPAAGSLLALLAELPDPRGCKGRRHPLAAMLAAILCGMLAGNRGCDSIAQWLRWQGAKVWHRLGFYRRPPCANTFRNLLAKVPPEVLEQKLLAWMQNVLPDCPAEMPRPTSLDGKSVKGALCGHDRCLHLLALFDQQTGGVMSQLAMPPDTNEHKAALALLERTVLKGRVVTGDAMFCQRDVCEQILAGGGDYLFVVKDNQPELKAAIAAEFEPGFSPL